MKSYQSKPGTKSTFEVDGVTFTTSGSVSLLELAEVARLADVDVFDPRGAAALAEFFESAMADGEYARFRQHVRKHGTDPETLLDIMGDLIQEAGQVPTQRPSPSTDGPTATGSTYRVVSGNKVLELPLTPEREAELSEAVRRAAG